MKFFIGMVVALILFGVTISSVYGLGCGEPCGGSLGTDCGGCCVGKNPCTSLCSQGTCKWTVNNSCTSWVNNGVCINYCQNQVCNDGGINDMQIISCGGGTCGSASGSCGCGVNLKGNCKPCPLPTQATPEPCILPEVSFHIPVPEGCVLPGNCIAPDEVGNDHGGDCQSANPDKKPCVQNMCCLPDMVCPTDCDYAGGLVPAGGANANRTCKFKSCPAIECIPPNTPPVFKTITVKDALNNVVVAETGNKNQIFHC
ncbi:MAG: hypothetical protein WCK35_11830 [Chloroflexota bacterium]